MRERDLTRLIRMLLQRTRGKQRIYGIVAIVALFFAYYAVQPMLARHGMNLPGLLDDAPRQSPVADHGPFSSETAGETKIVEAYEARRSDLIVQASAKVIALLPDDTTGIQHQKMLLKLPSGLTLKLAHNIDLADRVPAKRGDTVEFRGEYEYTEKGGVIHWTHHDPRGRHEGGWIKWNGKTYE